MTQPRRRKPKSPFVEALSANRSARDFRVYNGRNFVGFSGWRVGHGEYQIKNGYVESDIFVTTAGRWIHRAAIIRTKFWKADHFQMATRGDPQKLWTYLLTTQDDGSMPPASLAAWKDARINLAPLLDTVGVERIS